MRRKCSRPTLSKRWLKPAYNSKMKRETFAGITVPQLQILQVLEFLVTLAVDHPRYCRLMVYGQEYLDKGDFFMNLFEC